MNQHIELDVNKR